MDWLTIQHPELHRQSVKVHDVCLVDRILYIVLTTTLIKQIVLAECFPN